MDGMNKFYDYKNQLSQDLLTDKDIVKLLTDSDDMSNVKKLMYTQVFPFEFIPDTNEKAQTYICCEVDIISSENKTYLKPILYIWVFTHKSKMVLPNGKGVRVDALSSKICDVINRSKMYGLGELMFYSSKRFAPCTDYIGRMLVFHAKDFNALYDPTRKVPSVRPPWGSGANITPSTDANDRQQADSIGAAGGVSGG